MLSMLKAAARRILPAALIDRLRGRTPHVDEVTMIARLCRGVTGVMVDVGGHHGGSTRQFLDLGWSVIAYEPDPRNRAEFEKNIGAHPRVQLSTCAVADKEEAAVQLFSSEVSSGISGLSAFHPSHVPTATVQVVTLDRDLKRRAVDRVDFLKIDVEGYDFFALKGFDWALRPRFALYEFENRKTVPLGYTLQDTAAYMADRGYHLLYSVWEPIVEYGTQHSWRGLFRSAPGDVEACWGNVLCFRDRADLELCMRQSGGSGQRG